MRPMPMHCLRPFENFPRPISGYFGPKAYFIWAILILSGAQVQIEPVAGQTSVEFDSSNLPIVIIDTHGEIIPDWYKITADMGIIDNGPGMRNAITDPFNDYHGPIGIEIRGSSSQNFPKKQYAFETRDSLGNDMNVSLLGFPEESDWILYAPYNDKSMMRNVLAYTLSNRMGRYASRTRFCELVLNGDYRGVYVLMEKIKRDNHRVDISKLEPDETIGDDLTGGYIIKIDKTSGETFGGWTSIYPPYPNAPQRILYQYHVPDPEEIVSEQEQYIQSCIERFERTVLESVADPADTSLPNLMDVDSFVDFVLIQELGKNVDAYRLSTFLHKDRDSVDPLLKAGPIWDFDLAFGNADYYNGWTVEGWELDFLTEDHGFQQYDGFQVPFWWKRLVLEPFFAHALEERWISLRSSVFERTAVLSFIDSTSSLLHESSERNYERWPILGTYVWPNPFIGKTYQEEVIYLRSWIGRRLVWMDQDIPEWCGCSSQPSSGSPPEECARMPAHPNPFNASTCIEYVLQSPGSVMVTVLNIKGQILSTPVHRIQERGRHGITWQALDPDGRPLPSGSYIVRLDFETGGRRTVLVQKVTCLK